MGMACQEEQDRQPWVCGMGMECQERGEHLLLGAAHDPKRANSTHSPPPGAVVSLRRARDPLSHAVGRWRWFFHPAGVKPSVMV
jgi:hypothetical protein